MKCSFLFKFPFSIILKRFFKIIILLKLYKIINFIIGLFLIKNKSNSNKNFLILSPSKYRGDLKVLSRRFNMLVLPDILQYFIDSIFFKKLPKFENFREVKKFVFDNKETFNNFSKFLESFIKYNNISFIVSPSLHYKHDYLYAECYPKDYCKFLTIHRECLHASEPMKKILLEFWKSNSNYPGDFLIVQNKHAANIFHKANLFKKKEIFNLGCLRMQSLIEKVNKLQNNKETKKILLFSFTYGADGLDTNWNIKKGLTLKKMFDKAHSYFAELAQEHQNFEFIIKTKWGGNWEEKIISSLKNNKIDINKVKNLKIDYQSDPHKLILESKVIFAYGSSALLEAAFAKKKIIIPILEECLEKSHIKKRLLGSYFNLFNVVKNKNEFFSIFKKLLDSNKAHMVNYNKKKKVFYEWLAPNKDNTEEKFLNLVEKISKT